MAAEQPAATAGWYPDPDQVGTVRYWDGSAWTEQRAPAGSSAKPMNPAVIAGVGIALAGIVAIFIGVFLPFADSKSFARIVDNTVIHRSEGKILLGLAIVSVLAVYQNRQGNGWSMSVALLGLICLGITILMGTHMPELAPVNGEGLEALGLHPGEFVEKASPGTGVYVCGAGGLLLLIGGLILMGHAEGADESETAQS
jgi:hypothetical protein